MAINLSNELSYSALMKILNKNDKRNHIDIQRACLLYDNETVPDRTDAMTDTDYMNKQKAWSPVALTSVIVDKIAGALYGRPVSRTTGDEELDAFFKPIWADMGRTMLRVSKVASLVKNDIINISLRYPSRLKYGDYGIGNGVPILDPDDPHGRPIGLIYDYFTDTASIENQVNNYTSTNNKITNHIIEIVTRHQRDSQGNILIPGIHRLFIDGKLQALEDNGFNVLGDFLGAVFWRGSDHPTDAMGRSDIFPLINTLDALNNVLSTTHEKIIWNANSPIVTNVKGKLEFRVAPGEIWQVNSGGASDWFKRLESDCDVSPLIEFADEIIRMIHETARVPSVAVGDLEHIGNLASGRAFEISMIPLSDLISEKEVCAIPQEKELMAESIAWASYYGYLDGYTKPSAYGNWNEPDCEKINQILEKANVEFAPIAYPHDTSETINSVSTAVDKGLMSKETAISSIHNQWDSEDVKKEIELITQTDV